MRKITIKDVAREAGVSLASASRALNARNLSGPISEDKRGKVLDAARRLRYVGRQGGLPSSTRRTKLIGLVVPELTNPFFAELAQTIIDRLRSLGYQSLVTVTTDKYDKEFEQACVHTLLRRHVDGIIAIPASTRSLNAWQTVLDSATRLIFVDRDLQKDFPDVDSVTVNNRTGAQAATEYLLSSGHEHIGFLTGPTSASTQRLRREGYEDAHRKLGRLVDPDYVQECTFAIGSRHDAARKLLALEERPSAIFAPSNLLCESALVAIRERGLAIPKDISLLMFDDVHWATLADPKLTTVRNPPKNLGRAAVDLLVRKLAPENTAAPPEHIELQVAELVVRGSVLMHRDPQTPHTLGQEASPDEMSASAAWEATSSVPFASS